MAIRARLKSKIKSILFGSSTSSTTNANSSAVNRADSSVSKTTFVAPSVSTSATKSTSSSESASVADTTENEKIQSTAEIVEPVVTNKEPNTSSSTEELPDTQSGVDDSEASFVFEVEELFPETCPHCGASSHNNWIRIENKFACGSCEAAY